MYFDRLGFANVIESVLLCGEPTGELIEDWANDARAVFCTITWALHDSSPISLTHWIWPDLVDLSNTCSTSYLSILRERENTSSSIVVFSGSFAEWNRIACSFSGNEEPLKHTCTIIQGMRHSSTSSLFFAPYTCFLHYKRTNLLPTINFTTAHFT